MIGWIDCEPVLTRKGATKIRVKKDPVGVFLKDDLTMELGNKIQMGVSLFWEMNQCFCTPMTVSQIPLRLRCIRVSHCGLSQWLASAFFGHHPLWHTLSVCSIFMTDNVFSAIASQTLIFSDSVPCAVAPTLKSNPWCVLSSQSTGWQFIWGEMVWISQRTDAKIWLPKKQLLRFCWGGHVSWDVRPSSWVFPATQSRKGHWGFQAWEQSKLANGHKRKLSCASKISLHNTLPQITEGMWTVARELFMSFSQFAALQKWFHIWKDQTDCLLVQQSLRCKFFAWHWKMRFGVFQVVLAMFLCRGHSLSQWNACFFEKSALLCTEIICFVNWTWTVTWLGHCNLCKARAMCMSNMVLCRELVLSVCFVTQVPSVSHVWSHQSWMSGTRTISLTSKTCSEHLSRTSSHFEWEMCFSWHLFSVVVLFDRIQIHCEKRYSSLRCQPYYWKHHTPSFGFSFHKAEAPRAQKKALATPKGTPRKAAVA